MNYKALISAAMVASLSLGNMAYAYDDHDHRGPDRHDDRRGDRDGPRFAEGSHNDRDNVPRHRFQKGDRLPPEYRGRQYAVDDWRGHHLSAPPRGYHWVQSGGDYVLAAIATGIIASVLLNN
ncbi:RcnB family protein [Undibacterium sp. TJN25]|uniref:RcnB family protein n=1 Tax=Undibacterium sp. TJN25 TaxID=3413056 RepID=UPI003BF2AFE0